MDLHTFDQVGLSREIFVRIYDSSNILPVSQGWTRLWREVFFNRIVRTRTRKFLEGSGVCTQCDIRVLDQFVYYGQTILSGNELSQEPDADHLVDSIYFFILWIWFKSLNQVHPKL